MGAELADAPEDTERIRPARDEITHEEEGVVRREADAVEQGVELGPAALHVADDDGAPQVLESTAAGGKFRANLPCLQAWRDRDYCPPGSRRPPSMRFKVFPVSLVIGASCAAFGCGGDDVKYVPRAAYTGQKANLPSVPALAKKP